MEYAISAAAAALILALYAICRKKQTPTFCHMAGDDEFDRSAKSYVRSLSLPKKSCSMSAWSNIFHIKFGVFLLKRKRYCGLFDSFVEGMSSIKLKKIDLSDLPSVDGVPRAVLLARFCLANTNMRFQKERAARVIEEQNRWRTLAYCEVEGMGDAFEFAIVEGLSSLTAKLKTVAKCFDLAAKYIKGGQLPLRHKKLARSPLFLSLAARCAGYDSNELFNILSNCMAGLENEFFKLKESLSEVEKFDFMPFYTPLEIFDKYAVFVDADSATKRKFLCLLSKLSDRENVDEFLYAVKVDKYMHSASSGHMALKRATVFDRSISIISQKKDISMLGAALSSHYFMDLYFKPANSRASSRSITKIIEYENSFEPIYKFRTVNLGVSTKDGRLRLSPKLPNGVKEVDLKFEHMGVCHALHILRGEQKALYIGETRLEGSDEIRLGEIPLDITLVIADER